MTRRDVIRHIVERDLQGHGLTEEVVLQDDSALHESACELFGTWETALSYVGVDRHRITRPAKYSPEGVRRKIRRLSEGTCNLTSDHVRRRRSRLYRAAVADFERLAQH
jgi:hypothetical protein